MRKLPLNARGEFTIEVGKPTNAEMEHDAEWYRKAPWDALEPGERAGGEEGDADVRDSRGDEVDRRLVGLRAPVRGRRAHIDVHFGYDYHSQDHLKHSQARSTAGSTTAASARRWRRATRTRARAAPLTRTLDADGRSVSVEVRLFYGQPGTSTDPDTDAGGKLLEADMLASLEDARRHRLLRPLRPVLRLRARELGEDRRRRPRRHRARGRRARRRAATRSCSPRAATRTCSATR